jgi:hypothetical protein
VTASFNAVMSGEGSSMYDGSAERQVEAEPLPVLLEIRLELRPELLRPRRLRERAGNVGRRLPREHRQHGRVALRGPAQAMERTVGLERLVVEPLQ